MKSKHWFLIFVLWQIAGLIVTTIVAISAGTFHHFLHELILCLTFTNFVAIGAASLALAYQLKLKNTFNRRLLLALGVLALAAIVFLGVQISMGVGARVCGYDRFEVGRWHLVTIIVNIIILAATTVFAILLILYQRLANNLERKINENAKLTRLQLETRFALLQAKVNPHFLFNTLNTMLDVLRRDPKLVETMILNLSDIYRKTLAMPERSLVSIDEELELVREYLEIEKIRMGDRLDFRFLIDENLRHTKVPPMMLQILVENAIKHGITPKKQGGRVDIQVDRHEGKVVVGVQDSGVGIQPERTDTGYGLTCIKQRLKLLYDSAAVMRISLLPTGGTNVTIELPYEA